MHLLATLSLLARRWWLPIVFGVLTAGLSLWVQQARPASYVAETTLAVARVNRAETTEYQYDNYYAVQAAELTVNTVARWFEMADVAKAIGKRAGIEVADTDALAFVRRFKAKQASSHLLRLQVRAPSSEEASRLLQGAVDEVSARLSVLEVSEPKGTSIAPAFAVTADAPVVYQKVYESGIVAGAGAVAGVCIGLAFVIAEAALRSSRAKQPVA